jgi:hypothetical protein
MRMTDPINTFFLCCLKDGTFDKAEYPALTRALFLAADSDHDGTVNAAELSTEKGINLVALLANQS